MRLNSTFSSDAVSYVCVTYEKILNGEMKAFSPYFFNRQYRRFRIVVLVRYLVEDKLHMTPEEALHKITFDTLKQWKLVCLLKYVENYKPIEHEYNRRYVKHLIYYAYPELPQPSLKERVITTYKEVLSGKRNCFPKNYFRDKYGEERAKICFEYLWQEILKINFNQIPEVFLKDNETGLKLLQKYKLKILTQIIYYSVSDMIINMYPDIDLTKVSIKKS